MTESLITSIVNCTSVEAPRELSVFSATATSIFGPLIAVGNFLVVYSVYHDPNKDLRTAFNFFVVNLAIADLFVGLLVCPLSVATHIAEATGHVSRELKTLRQSLHLSYFLSVSASLLNLAALCIDRVIAIRFPFMYRVDLSFWHHVISAVIIWLAAISVSFVYFEIGYEQMAMIMAIFSVLFTFVVMVSTVCLLYISVKNRGRNPSFDSGAKSVDMAMMPVRRRTPKSLPPLEDANHAGQACSHLFVTSQESSGSRRVTVKGLAETEEPIRGEDDSRGEMTQEPRGCKSNGSQMNREMQIQHHVLEKHDLKRVRSSIVLGTSTVQTDPNAERSHSWQCHYKHVSLSNESPVMKLDTGGHSACGLGFLDETGGEIGTFYDGNSETSVFEIAEKNAPKRTRSNELKDERKNTGEKYKLSAVVDDCHKTVKRRGSVVSEHGEVSGKICRMFQKKSSNGADSVSQSVRMHCSVSNVHRKLVLTLLIMLSAFLVCFVPSCGMVIYLNTSEGDCRSRHWMRDLMFLLAIANSAVNPFIYAWRLPSFRKAVRMIICPKGRNQIKPRGGLDDVAVA